MAENLDLSALTSEASEASHSRKDGKRTKLATSHKTGSEVVEVIGGEWKFQKKPAFLAERNTFWDTLYVAQTEKFLAMPKQPITVTLPDGKQKQGTAFVTSPLDVATMISN